MTQDPNDNSLYTVTSTERVTVSLQSVQCNCLTSAGFDGQALAKQSAAPDVYSFGVTGNSGDQKVFAGVCTFSPSNPPTAHYTVQVSGSLGGSFQASSVFKTIPGVAFQLFFTIA
jgi:hypothetical protein